MGYIRIPRFSFPHLEPNEEIDTVVSPATNYDETLLGSEYEVIAVDPNRSYDDAELEA